MSIPVRFHSCDASLDSILNLYKNLLFFSWKDDYCVWFSFLNKTKEEKKIIEFLCFLNEFFSCFKTMKIGDATRQKKHTFSGIWNETKDKNRERNMLISTSFISWCHIKLYSSGHLYDLEHIKLIFISLIISLIILLLWWKAASRTIDGSGAVSIILA